MAEVTLTTYRSALATTLPPSNSSISGLTAGEDLLSAAPCYIKSDGLVYMSTAAAANAAAEVNGWTVQAVKSGNPVSIYRDVSLNYGAAGTFTHGAKLYLSATVAGGLQTAAQANQTTPIAFAVDGTRIRVKATL